MIRTEQAHLQVAAISHAGMAGKNNEDRFAVSAYQLGMDNPTPSVLAVLCDGIGGHRAGEIAADLAVNSISQVVAECDGSQPLQVLQEAIHTTSQKIYHQSQDDSGQRGMGSTCACAWIIGNRLYTVTVGDSRIYLQRGEAITQLSTDHTWIQEMQDRGLISPDQAHSHPNAHMIRRYLGSPIPPEGDFRLRIGTDDSDELALTNQGLILQPGDKLLLCTDGLTDLVKDSEICTSLNRDLPGNHFKPPHLPSNPDQALGVALQELVDLANQRGGHDNITAIVMQVPPIEAGTSILMMKPTQVLPTAYGLKGSIDLTHNTRLAVLLNIGGTVLLFFFGWLFLIITQFIRPDYAYHLNLMVSSVNDLLKLIGVLLLVTLVMILVHEGVHGLFFLVYTHQRPSFGFRGYYAFASAPSWYLPRNPYLVVSLAPFVLISIIGSGLLAILPYVLIPPMLLLISMNAAGAIGDLMVSIWLLNKPATCLIQDFGDKVSLYLPKG